MFDSHVHFDAAPFSEDLDRVVQEAEEVGVSGAVNPGVDLASSRKALQLHRSHPWILPAFGIHPLRLFTWEGDAPGVAEMASLAAEGAYVAIGEIGLDFSRGREEEDRQRAFLDAQARLAKRLDIPILLHVRKGFYEAFTALREAGFDGAGVSHAFSGSRDMARLALDRGFYLSACAIVTRPSGRALLDLFRWAPRDRILVETDAPDLPPWTHGGRLHRPSDLPITVSALAAGLGLGAEETALLTEHNARRMLAGGRAE